MSKRILIVIESLSQGGAEVVAINLANGLVRRGASVCVCAANGALRPRLNPDVLFAELPRFDAVSIVAIIGKLNQVIQTFKPDVIHSHNATHSLLVRLIFLFRTRPKLILTYHSKSTKRFPNIFSGIIFNFLADRIIAIASHRKQSLIRIGVRPARICSVPNFIELAEWEGERKTFDKRAFREKNGLGLFETVLLISTRLIVSKNVDLFLKIICEISKRGRNVAGIVLGDGPERLSLERLSRQLNIDRNVIFPGFRDNVKPYYLASDIFIFPSKYEVLPMALIEACAAGLPIICSDISGNDEVVRQGSNGFLLKGDEHAYSEKAIELSNNNELYKLFSKNALKTARELFDVDACLSKTLEIYD